MPKTTLKMAFSASRSRFADGSRVGKGAVLTAPDAGLESKIRATSTRIATLGARHRASEVALSRIQRGTFPISFAVPHGNYSTELRSIEHSIESALITAKQERLDYLASLAEAKALPSSTTQEIEARNREIKRVKDTHRLAMSESRVQVRGLLESAVVSSSTLLKQAKRELAGLQAVAPWDATVSLAGDEVHLESTAYTFVFVATEGQADAIASQKSPRLQVRGADVGELQLRSVVYDAESSTGPTTPRYKVTFDVTPSATSFTPRSHGAASLVSTGDQLAIPPAFLGINGEAYYVIHNGTQRNVTVTKDADGQYLLTGGGLKEGDRVEKIPS